jgi:glycosyltransferase involved in cell wall biosynthesis
MAGDPKVTVLLPVYNAGGYLAPAVESILGQTLRDFELLAIDDGSADDSRGMLERYAHRDPRIRVISRPNRGLTATLNEGIEAARGDYIARMDADDEMAPERLARQVALLEARPDVGVVFSGVTLIDAAGRVIAHLPSGTVDPERFHRRLLEGRNSIVHPTVTMRTAIARAVGGYPEDYPHAEDYAMWLRMAEHTHFECCPEPLLRYRLLEASVSSKNSAALMESMRRAQADACARAGIEQAFEGTPVIRGEGRGGLARHIESMLTGTAWLAWRRGDRRRALRLGLQALRRRPYNPGAWKSLLMLATKPPPPAEP